MVQNFLKGLTIGLKGRLQVTGVFYFYTLSHRSRMHKLMSGTLLLSTHMRPRKERHWLRMCQHVGLCDFPNPPSLTGTDTS